ncbi:MAG: 30S ribosomal protein S20 [Lachnospiraceae bacterium]|nr:30S ribosomal protein S20 [Lachnospiraceae bacterium]
MANIKSAKKRVLVAARNAERNKAIRSDIKTAVKKVNAAIAAGDKAAAQETLKEATKKLDMAATKGVFHKNMTSRKVSRMAKAVSGMEQ